MIDYLEAGLRELGIDNPEQKTKLSQYLVEIMRFNPLYGLVGGNDKDDIIIRHILDSLAPWKRIAHTLSRLSASTGREIADIGSGAGFPGVPLAVVLENDRFLLVEKMARRVTFLQNVKAALRLPNVVVVEGAVEQAAKDGIRVDMALCRGFSAINDRVIGTFSRLLKPGGRMVFYKGKREKIDRETASCTGLEPRSWEIEPYSPPFLREERHLVIITNDDSS
jgi:16S rRNA (guanine527-N7)-methyltransferase